MAPRHMLLEFCRAAELKLREGSAERIKQLKIELEEREIAYTKKLGFTTAELNIAKEQIKEMLKLIEE